MSWKKIISTVAPTLATALGGPLAGTATKFLTNELIGENGSEADLDAFLSNPSPEQLGKLREIDNNFKLEMRRQEIDLERINMEDRKSARDREARTGDRVPAVLAMLVTIGFFSVLCYMIINGLPESNQEPLLVMLGSLGTAWTGIIAYYFGSSAGSKAKTDLMGKK